MGHSGYIIYSERKYRLGGRQGVVPNSTGLKYDTAKKMNGAVMTEAERQGLTTGEDPVPRSGPGGLPFLG